MLPDSSPMTSAFRLFLPLFLVAFVLPAFGTPAAWDGSFTHRLDAKSDKLPNNRAVLRVRCRAKAGEVVWATLRGVASDEQTAAPLRDIGLEYDPSGGRGEWEPANRGDDGSLGFEIRAPSNGLVEFRVRAQKPDIVEHFSLDYGADTAGAKPLFFTANEFKSSLDAGYEKVYPLNALRGNSTYEIEIWAEGFEPAMVLKDPKGNELDYTLIERTSAFVARRYTAPLEGRNEFKVKSRNGSGGKYLLRVWYPLPVQRRK